MIKPAQWLGQALLYGLFAAVVAYFSASPDYTHLPPDQALIKLSLSHPGNPIRECRRLTPEEIAALPPNMRRPTDCPRERLPVYVELEIDGKLLYSRGHAPAGLWDDGPSTVYQRFPVTPGRHRLVVRLRDSDRNDGFDYQHSADIELTPLQNFVIDFRAEVGGFILM